MIALRATETVALQSVLVESAAGEMASSSLAHSQRHSLHRYLQRCQFLFRGAFRFRSRRLQSVFITINPNFAEVVLVAVAAEDNLRHRLAIADRSDHVDDDVGAAVLAAELQRGRARVGIELADQIITGGHSRVTRVELEGNADAHLRVTNRLRLGRRGQGSDQNQYRDHCVSCLFHFRVSFGTLPVRSGFCIVEATELLHHVLPYT